MVVSVYKLAGAVKYTYKAVWTAYSGHKSPYTKTVYTYDKDINGNTLKTTKKETKVSKNGKFSKKHYVYKNGKLYKTVSSSSEFKNYVSSDGHSVSNTKLGTYTLTGVSNAGDGISVMLNEQNILDMEWEVTSPTHSHSFTGTELNEYAYSTPANETFRMGAGKDKIYFNSYANYGNDYVYFSKNSTLNLIFGAEPVKYERYKNTNDVILWLGDDKGSNGKVTLKSYLSQKTATVNINGTDLNSKMDGQTYGSAGATKKQTLIGTRLNETFNCGTKNDFVATGGGNDIVYTGTGNATININAGGQKHIYIGAGSNTDYITRDSYGSGTAYLHLTPESFSKRDDNLVIKRGSGETVVRGFFYKDGNAYRYTYTSDDMSASLGSRLENSDIKLLVDKKESSTTSARGSKYSDKIYGGKRTNYIDADKGNNEIYLNAERKGKTTIKAGNGNDEYYIQNDLKVAKNRIIIKDSGGNNDKIIFSSRNSMVCFFDVSVDSEGNINNGTDLRFFDFSAFSGATSRKQLKQAVSSVEKVTVNKALTSNGESGKGWIESGLVNSYGIANIRSDVASWLQNNSCTSVTQALNKVSDAGEISKLIQIYINNGTV